MGVLPEPGMELTVAYLVVAFEVDLEEIAGNGEQGARDTLELKDFAERILGEGMAKRIRQAYYSAIKG